MRPFPSLWLLGLPLLGGCQFLPHHHFFTPPPNEANPAWVRIVNYTQHAEIHQFEGKARTGGLIRNSEWVLRNTQDRGIPKAGQALTSDYYETPVRPNLETEVSISYQGGESDFCTVSPRFTPKAGHYYQFLLSAGYRTGMCTMHATLIERDADGQGWHLSPNPEVTYSSGSNESKTLYIFDPRREPPNPVYQPVGRPSFP